jgi:hypothetical protein
MAPHGLDLSVADPETVNGSDKRWRREERHRARAESIIRNSSLAQLAERTRDALASFQHRFEQVAIPLNPL